jgi:hypothetical protein
MKLQDEMCGEVLKMLYGRYILIFLTWNLLSYLYNKCLRLHGHLRYLKNVSCKSKSWSIINVK